MRVEVGHRDAPDRQSVGWSVGMYNFLKGREVTLPRSKRSSFIYTRCNPNPTNISVNTLTQVKLFWHLYNHKNIHQAGYITTVRKRVVPFLYNILFYLSKRT